MNPPILFSRYIIGLRAGIVLAAFIAAEPCADAGDTACAFPDSVQMLLVGRQYDAAIALCNQAIRCDPHDAAPRYWRTAIEQSRILDFEAYTLHFDRFIALSGRTIDTLRMLLPRLRGRDSLDCILYIGNTRAGQAVFYAKNGDWWRGFQVARAAVSQLRRVYDLDSSRVAALLGIGAYEYYFNKQLAWLPWAKARMNRALAMIRRSTRAPFPFNLGARNTLCWILIERGEYASADSIAAGVLEKYPRYSVFIRIRTYCAYVRKKPVAMLEHSARLLAASAEGGAINWSDRMLACRVQAAAYLLRKDTRRACEAAGHGLALTIPSEYRTISYIHDHTLALREIREECLKNE